MKKPTRYSLEVCERTVWLMFVHQGEHESQSATRGSIPGKIYCKPETLRK